MGSDGRAVKISRRVQRGTRSDPIDFRAYTTIDIYKEERSGPTKRGRRPGRASHNSATSNRWWGNEPQREVLGAKPRSGGQWDVWSGVLPVGPDGIRAHFRQAHRRERQKGAGVWRRTSLLDIDAATEQGSGQEESRAKLTLRRRNGKLYRTTPVLAEEFLSTTKDLFDGEFNMAMRRARTAERRSHRPTPSRFAVHRVILAASSESEDGAGGD